MPVCPPSWKLAQSQYVALAKHLRAHNWAWGDEMLLYVVAHLLADGIEDARALHSVELADVVGVEFWPSDVWRVMDSMTRFACTMSGSVAASAEVLWQFETSVGTYHRAIGSA